mmetsp:Transcript_41556/g.72069  ORF Transcript_41556/g.72069 Transcript_41556/m.72069 type:complete len:435 (+) Transcript_41556:77-1381(+)
MFTSRTFAILRVSLSTMPTLNARISPSPPAATNSTSEVLTSPTAELTTTISTSDTAREAMPCTICFNASNVPTPSALITTFTLIFSTDSFATVAPKMSPANSAASARAFASARRWASVSSRIRRTFASASLRSAISFAMVSVSTESISWPEAGRVRRPSRRTAFEGKAVLTGSPLSLTMLFTLPQLPPTTIGSPTLRAPQRTKISATTPLPFSIFASNTTASACPVMAACNSSTSACNNSPSISWLMPSPVRPATSTTCTSPPNSSAIKSLFSNCVNTRLRAAVRSSYGILSILFNTTMIEQFAFLAMFNASNVCGRTPSSIATTKITKSVATAPWLRIELNAACPGVSKNITFRPAPISTPNALSFCVMPPASLPATSATSLEVAFFLSFLDSLGGVGATAGVLVTPVAAPLRLSSTDFLLYLRSVSSNVVLP